MFNQAKVLELLEKAAQKHSREKYATGAFKPRLRYYKRSNTFKASNCEFNPETFIATSYSWWEFVKVIGGKVVFNDYRYSPSTGQHQRKIRTLLNQLGIKIDFEIACPKGLQDLAGAIEWHKYLIKGLEAQIVKPGTRKAKNVERAQSIVQLKQDIETLERLAKYNPRFERLAA